MRIYTPTRKIVSRRFVAASSQYAAYIGTGINPANPHTIAGWFLTVDGAVAQTLFSVHDSTATTAGFSRLVFQGNVSPKELRANSGGAGGADQQNAKQTITYASRWHHAAGVFVPNSYRAAYLDGIGVADTNATGNAMGTTLGGIQAGTVSGTGPTNIQFMDGYLSEWGLWNTSLAEGEIRRLVQGESPLRVRPDNLIGYWPMGREFTETDEYGFRYPLTLSSAGMAVGMGPPRAIARQRMGRIYVFPAAGGAPANTITTAHLPAGVGYMGSGQTKSILPAGVGYMG